MKRYQGRQYGDNYVTLDPMPCPFCGQFETWTVEFRKKYENGSIHVQVAAMGFVCQKANYHLMGYINPGKDQMWTYRSKEGVLLRDQRPKLAVEALKAATRLDIGAPSGPVAKPQAVSSKPSVSGEQVAENVERFKKRFAECKDYRQFMQRLNPGWNWEDPEKAANYMSGSSDERPF